MTDNSLKDLLWIVIGCHDNEMGVCGVFSSEEIANEKIAELRASYEQMVFWMCPADKDVLIGGDEDRLADMPDRVYQIHDMDIEIEVELLSDEKFGPFKRKSVNRKGLRVVK